MPIVGSGLPVVGSGLPVEGVQTVHSAAVFMSVLLVAGKVGIVILLVICVVEVVFLIGIGGSDILSVDTVSIVPVTDVWQLGTIFLFTGFLGGGAMFLGTVIFAVGIVIRAVVLAAEVVNC